MATDISPAVERVIEAARLRAVGEEPRLADWLAELLADDEAKPARTLAELGLDPAELADRAGREPSPPGRRPALIAAAADWAVALRGDGTVTTDCLLLAVVEADPEFRRRVVGLGLDPAALVQRWRVDSIAPPADPPPAEPLAAEPAAPRDCLAAARVVDANLNRVRESLRVLEDHNRFGLDDRGLSSRLKELRHRLTDAERLLPARLLLAARDTVGDVGTTISTAAEGRRESPAAVAVANLKRLQESLRSAEEFGKVLDPAFGRAVEQLRYEAYTVEKAFVLGSDARGRLADARLYLLLAGSACRLPLDRTIAEAAAGGVDVIQLREKDLPDRELLAQAAAVRRWTREAGVLFVVNDRADVAAAVGADGVHVGQDDLPVAAARRVVGSDALVGVSTHDLGQLRAAVRDGADYVGVGPMFPSRTKPFADFPGLEFAAAAAAETRLPAFALGGITVANAHAVLATGIQRVAVSAAILESGDPRTAASDLRRTIEEKSPIHPDMS